MVMPDYNDFAPKPVSDREWSKFRAGSDRRHTRVAVAVEALPEEELSIFDQLLLEMRATRIGIELLIRLMDDHNDIDLVEYALLEANEDAT